MGAHTITSMATYETAISGIRILPGAWRPHYPFEHIAWISPPWTSHDYIWFDFPEAIFTDIGLLYLSHVNPPFPQLFRDLPRVEWETVRGGISYERRLPNGMGFGGSLTKVDEDVVGLELHIDNQGEVAIDSITLQTCIFLRAAKEFSEFTADNKYVHLPDEGWVTFPEATEMGGEGGRFRIGWRGGPASADLPVMATLSREGERLVAVTWFDDTYSLVTNPGHPCMHADPAFPKISSGDSASIKGEVIFYEGKLDGLTDLLHDRGISA